MVEKEKYRVQGGILAAAVLVGLDQLTKYLARAYLAGKAGVSLIPGVFELFYLENRGAAFGMFANRQWFFVAIAVLMILASAWLYRSTPALRHYRAMRFVCVLIASGAVGNMLDRLIFRCVTDFLYFSLIDFPVFNVADCYVCVGAALAVLFLFTIYRDDDFSFLFSGKRGEGR